jgi:hypothetical protein
MDRRPVLYLDLDDTLLSWAEGHPKAAPGAREFLLWALENYEVRWLTTWCQDGRLKESLLQDLCKMLQVEPDTVQHIRGFDWQVSDCKLNGIGWLEHVALGRPFVWLEDDYGMGERELQFLAAHGWSESYYCCNVTRDPQAMLRLHRRLKQARQRATDHRE